MTMLQVILNYDIEKEVIAFDETLAGSGHILVDDGGLKSYFVKLQGYKAELIKKHFINPPSAENLYINPNFVIAVGDQMGPYFTCLTYGTHNDARVQVFEMPTNYDLLEFVDQKKSELLLAE